MKQAQDHSTAILVFANSSERELQQKPMLNCASLFDILNQRTLKIVQATGLPYLHYTEREQHGASFKERFVNALAEVFELGYEKVIAVGNDTPHLNTADLSTAYRNLNENKFVLGPSADGGIYLMGIRKCEFDKGAMLRLPWQSPNLARSLVKLARHKKNVTLLRTLFDLDSRADLRRFIFRFRNIGRRLFSVIQALIQLKKINSYHFISRSTTGYSPTFFNKGSPSF